MFLRRTTVTSHGRRYEYMHLVEAYRRESDGRPTHRLIANLGPFNDRTFENISLALNASKDLRRVVVAPMANRAHPPKPTANLRYLDVAVVLDLWREWGLDKLLGEIMPKGDAVVGYSEVIAALTIQRCVEPDSKLAATRWFPHTAMPELLGISPAQFNNTRVHRALDELERVTVTLMGRLPEHYQSQRPAFATLFLDVTDTWFVGHGPKMAERAKTKEGISARKIGIVLLCSERGYPLRWEVVPGRRSDSRSMMDLLEGIAGLQWAKEVPVVMDRAMGKTALIETMTRLKVRFLTAITTPEFSSYAPDLPWATVAGLMPKQEGDTKVSAEAARLVAAAGMHEVASDLFVVDCGVVATSEVPQDEPEVPTRDDGTDTEDPTVRAMRLCRELNRQVADGHYSSYAAAGKAVGLHKGLVGKYREFGKLCEDLQHRLLSGDGCGRSLAALLAIARLDTVQAQQAAFDALLASPKSSHTTASPPAPRATVTQTPPSEPTPEPLRVRVVGYFNPDRFIEQRWLAIKKLEEISAFAASLNTKLSRATSKMGPDKIRAAVYQKLRADDLVTAFTVEVVTQTLPTGSRFQVQVEPDKAQWESRRRYDGFSVLLGHPDLGHKANELCQLYRDKDTVEKDFQCIKSVLELRPVRHHNEDKVRAHVTLCMLALLLERTLAEKLNGQYSAVAALDHLDRARLNWFRTQNGPSLYSITELDKDQTAILRALRLKHLGDDHHLAARVIPR